MSFSPQTNDPQKLRFDNYEVDARAGELRKYGYRVRLENRPFRALEILLKHAPEVVTREELQKQLWPADVFVDFDHGLNKAIGKVRRALNDNAEQPRFVETVGRRGYRFIAAVNQPIDQPADQQVLPVAPAPPSNAEGEQHHPRSWGPLYVTAAAFIVILVIALLGRPTTPKLQVVKIQQITKSGEAWPLEPMTTDGPRLYYQSLAWPASATESARNWGIKQVLLNGNEESVVASADPAHFFRIRGLSSDDTEFLGLLRSGDEQWVAATMPVVGGSPRRLGGTLLADGVAWSHDGRVLAYSRDHQIYVANPDGTGSRELATLPGGAAYLAWSPDDRHLGFTVFTEQQTLWEVGADGRGLHQLLNWPGKAMECCGSWTPDGRYYVFRSRREGPSNLWAIEEKSAWWRRGHHDPVQLTFGPLNFYQPLPSRDGKTIFAIGNLFAGELVRYDAKRKDFVPFLDGLFADHLEFNRDGKWIAYVTIPDRTLWRARSDGSEAFQITFPPLDVDSRPHWSADGKRITFAARKPGERLRLYTVSAAEGTPEPLPAEPHSQATPDWIPNEDALIYGSYPGLDDPSAIALYRMDLRTHHSERIPASDGLYNPLWSPDGNWLAVVDATSQRVLLFDVKTGKRTELTHPATYPVWSADSQYIYYSAHYPSPEHAIYRVHVPGGPEEKVLDVSFRSSSASFGLTPDGTPIILREHGHYDVYALSLATPPDH